MPDPDSPSARASWLPLDQMMVNAFDARLWGADASTSRSREITPLYAHRFVGVRGNPIFGSHPFWEISFVFRGQGVMIDPTGTQNVPMLPNSAVLLPPGIPHRESSTQEEMDTLWIGLRGQRVGALTLRRITALTSLELAPVCEQLWLRGRTAQPGSGPGPGPELDGLAQVLFAKLLRLLAGDTSSNAEGEMLDDALRYLQQHLGEPIHIAALAERFGCSEGHFYRTFKNKTGVTPVTYLTRLRIQTATQLMRESRLPISRIASLVGYPDALYFSRVFKKVTGKGPTQAARQMRQK